MIWVRADGEAKMLVEWSTIDGFADPGRGEALNVGDPAWFLVQASPRRAALGSGQTLPCHIAGYCEPERLVRACRGDNTANDEAAAMAHPGRAQPAAHRYSPDCAQVQGFEPFWEFVSDPLHAGTFGPNGYHNIFRPEVKFAKAPTAEQAANLPPAEVFSAR
jgi:hypothetical protein